MDDWYHVGPDHIYISIYLEANHSPDPTGITDDVALGLLVLYVAYTFIVNSSLACIAARWKFVQSINIPLVYMMSMFSACHLFCIFLDMYYVRPVTEYVQTFSCVATPYWGEYFFGLCSFMAVLGVRMYSLLMVSVDALRPKGARYRRTVIKCIFFCIFLLPIYGLCILASVDDLRTASPTWDNMCRSPASYKLSLVAILVYYAVVLTGMAIWLTRTGINREQVLPIQHIIALSIPLLVVSCVVHFAFMMPHYWGRFVFMCVAFVLHMFAHMRITLPIMWEYVWVDHTAHSEDLSLDIDSDAVVSSVSREPFNAFRTESALKMNDDVKWIMTMLEGGRCKLTPEVLRRFPEIRVKFFNGCKLTCTEEEIAFVGDTLKEVIPFEDDYVEGFPVYRILTFYEDVSDIYTQTKAVYTADVYQNSKDVGKIVRMKIKNLWLTFLAPFSRTPVAIPTKMSTRILNGFKAAQMSEWDTEVLSELMNTILAFLIELDVGIFLAEFDDIIYEMCQRYGEKIDAMDAENLMDLTAEVIATSSNSHFAQLLQVLQAGPAALHSTHGIPQSCMLALEDDIYGNVDDDGTMDMDNGETLHVADSRFTDEYMQDGSVRYASASRATLYFIHDVFFYFYRIPARCISSLRAANSTISLQNDEIGLVSD